MQRISALNKMVEEMDFDCDTCAYNNVCGDVAELWSMRNRLVQRREAVHA